MTEQDRSKKPRNRGAVYPVEIIARLTEDMGERMDEVIRLDPTQTKVGLIRKALDKYLPKSKKAKKPIPESDE